MLTTEELINLYAQDRIVILPCAPGDPVYKLTETDDGIYSMSIVHLNATELISYSDVFDEIYFTDEDEARTYVNNIGGQLVVNI